MKSSKPSAVVALILLVSFVGIAITDPMMSPQRYREIGAGNIAPNEEDYTEARFLLDAVRSTTSLMVPYEISTCFGYLEVVEGKIPHKYYATSADFQRVIISNITEHKELLPELMYVWPKRWLPDIKSHLNNVPIYVFYDSERYVIFEKVL